MDVLDWLRPRRSPRGKDLGKRLPSHRKSENIIEGASLEVHHALSGGPIPLESGTTVATEMARDRIASIGGVGVHLGRSFGKEKSSWDDLVVGANRP